MLFVIVGVCAFYCSGAASDFACTTDMNTLPVSKSTQKGLNIDDTTFHWCSADIPSVWPNTQQPVQSIRTFKSWQIDWPDFNRLEATSNLIDFATTNNIKVLIGTQVTCNATDDALEWNRTMDIMRRLGPEHIMGLAVGNEQDLLYTKDYIQPFEGCIEGLWKGGYYWRTTQERIAAMDKMGNGFQTIPVTSVFSGAALTSALHPFQEDSNAMVTSYLRNASATYGSRWAWSFNIYTFWNPFYITDFPFFTGTCNGAIQSGTSWQNGDVITSFKAVRYKIHQITGNWDDRLWIGEIGWSSPNPSTAPSLAAKHCADFASARTYGKFYRNFLSYDMTMPDGYVGPDHVFYFTIRDATQFGSAEHFGLLAGGPDPTRQCEYKKCKLQAKDFTLDRSNERGIVVV